jgi:hypothetical protein
MTALATSGIGTSLTSRDVRLESAKRANAAIDQIAVANCDFMTAHPKVPLLPSRTHIDAETSNPFFKTRGQVPLRLHCFAVIAWSF